MKTVTLFTELVFQKQLIIEYEKIVFVLPAIHLLMKNVLILSRQKKVYLPTEVLSTVFKYLNDLDLIEVPAACKHWNLASKSARFSAKLV